MERGDVETAGSPLHLNLSLVQITLTVLGLSGNVEVPGGKFQVQEAMV